ncbi:MAG: diaminopimelate decarboxylase family protein [Promethearchaeota archaeon]
MKKISGNSYLKKENGIVKIDSIVLDELINKFKTPFLIFIENRIRDNINSFKNIFNSIFENFHCFYSFKANFLPDICKIIESEGIGAEVIGLPEFNLSLKIGFDPDKIIVGGPYLPIELIKKSIINNVREIIVYNLNDLKRIDVIAQKYGKVQNICIRINSQKYKSKLGIIFSEKNLKILENIIKTSKNIKITTILSHYSSQMNNIEQFKNNIKAIAKSLKKIKSIGLNIKNLNLGGGFPEASVMPIAQLKKIASEINAIINEFNINYKNIYFEPGRYFVGDAGLFISEIIKVSEERWIFLNIGNHICPKFARCSLRFYNISQIDRAHKYKTSIAGIVPTDQDVLAKNYFFTENLTEGDKVLVTNVGAYTLTFSNRFPYTLPEIFLVKESNLKKIFDPFKNNDFSLQ